MEKETTLHYALSSSPTPEGLYEATLLRVGAARVRAARIRAGIFGVVALLCLGVLVPVLEYTLAQLYASGFYDYASLLLSDRSLVMQYWSDFGLSLIESLPSIAFLLLLPITVALLWSLSRLIKNFKTAIRFA